VSRNRSFNSQPTRRGSAATRAAGPLVISMLATAGLILPACSFDSDSSARTTKPAVLRLENATASTIEVILEVLDDSGAVLDLAAVGAVEIPVVTITDSGVNFGVLDPIGASAAANTGNLDSQRLETSATVRVPGFAVSEGGVYCGQTLRITAQVDEDDSPIRLSGAGSGIPAFDEGSVGETGERYLLTDLDFVCGETIVVRIGEDQSGAGSSTSGTVAVVAEGADSPFEPIVDPGTSSGDDPDDPDADSDPSTIAIQVANQGAVIGTLRLEVTTSTGGTQDFEVTVPPAAITEGAFACGTQFKFVATYPDPENPEDQETERVVVLTGAGTGSLGFDEASVARNGERFLIVGSDVSCGDTVRVTLRDDVEPIGFQDLGVFSGSVEVFAAE
jgi:hypothetical protein